MTDFLVNEDFLDLDLADVPRGQSSGLLELSPLAMASAISCGDIESSDYSEWMVPRSKWDEVAGYSEKLLRDSVPVVLNQGSESSCVANATVGAMQICGRLQFGERYPLLSPMSLFERIGLGAGGRNGAYIPRGIEEANKDGALPLNTTENEAEYAETYPPRGWNPRRLAALNWKPTARLFRIDEVVRVNTEEGWFSALVNGWPIVYGRRGHAIYSLFPKKNRGRWIYGYVNSWRNTWGDFLNDRVGKGLGWDSASTIRGCVGYAVKSVVRNTSIGRL